MLYYMNDDYIGKFVKIADLTLYSRNTKERLATTQNLQMNASRELGVLATCTKFNKMEAGEVLHHVKWCKLLTKFCIVNTSQTLLFENLNYI
jgi:hypothetical protein